jgi:hypothetical protein
MPPHLERELEMRIDEILSMNYGTQRTRLIQLFNEMEIRHLDWFASSKSEPPSPPESDDGIMPPCMTNGVGVGVEVENVGGLPATDTFDVDYAYDPTLPQMEFGGSSDVLFNFQNS